MFAILADLARHEAIDGSGMLRSRSSGSVISGVGDVFRMRMFNEEMGDYEKQLRRVIRDGDRWIETMASTLERLELACS